MAFLELNDVSKRFGPVDALHSFSLEVEDGELVAILGPSGCGKTTTLSILAGFTEPTGGDIRIDGRSMRDVPAHKRNIGVVFQNYALFPHLNVWNNVAFGLKMRKVERADLVRRVQAAIDLVHLKGFESRYARELSGGQQQRVALARALVIEPSLLLLDEPLSNLDATLREEMRFEIRDIQQRIGITTVFVTHDQSEAMAMADRLVVMNKGRICQVGRPRDIYQSPADPFVAKFIGGANLLRGTITGSSNGFIRVKISDEVVLLARSTTAVDQSQSVELVFRPEDATVNMTPLEGCNNLPVTISRITYLGATIEIAAGANGQSFSAIYQAHDDRNFKTGDHGYLSWKPDRGVLIATADPSAT